MSRPSGHTAVMAQRLVTPPDALDYFPTPPWAARAGAEVIRQLDPEARTAEDPACGEGHLAHGLRDYFDQVAVSDVFDYGGNLVADFLDPARDQLLGDRPDWVVINPPFKLGEAFIRSGLDRARRGVAVLVRLAFIEGVGRYPLFYGPQPMARMAPFSERVPMVQGRWDPDVSSATAYAWFYWIKPCVGRPAGMPAHPAAEVLNIAPGARERLTRWDRDEPFAVIKAARGAEVLKKWSPSVGPVNWWRFPVREEPFFGTPADDGWPGDHTHWTRRQEPAGLFAGGRC